MGRGWDAGARPPAPDEFHPDNTRRAWISLALTLVTLPAGVVVGSLVIDALGYSAEAESLPPWVRAAGGAAALVVILLAPLMAVMFGRSAMRAGDPRGRVPALIGAIGSALFVLQNVAAAMLA